jgi:hypothetical protein
MPQWTFQLLQISPKMHLICILSIPNIEPSWHITFFLCVKLQSCHGYLVHLKSRYVT